MGLKLKHSRWFLRSHGLESRVVELENGSTIHCWVPAGYGHDQHHKELSSRIKDNHDGLEGIDAVIKPKPALLLLHGFGGDGTMAWESQVPCLAKHFSLFLPDLLFFGESRTTNKQRSEFFQAECMFTLMQRLGVREALVGGHSYGGFVAYRMAHEYPHFVTRLLLISSGVMMGPTSNEPLLKSFGASKIEDVLVPQNVADMKKGLKFVFNKFPSWLPNFIFKDMFQLMSGNRQSRLELVEGIILGKDGAPPLPRVQQDVFVVWGDRDQIFNVELAHQLKDFLGDKAELAVITGVGHVPPMENPKKLNQLMLHFLTSL